ncbi:hypothetical protein Tco_0213233 [Tanacetum coccineum]
MVKRKQHTLDYGSTSVPQHALAPISLLNHSNQKDLILSIKSYFRNSSPVNQNKLHPRNYSFEEWLKVKIEHMNMDKSVKGSVINEWILDSFDVEANFAGICNDPYSRSLDEYKAVFDNEIEQLANEYELRIGKKGYILDDIWEKCKHVHGGTLYSWQDDIFKEEKRRESGLDEKYYDPPQVFIETFKVKRYSFEEGKSFVYVTKQLHDALPLGCVNGSRFKGMIRSEMDIRGSVQREE